MDEFFFLFFWSLCMCDDFQLFLFPIFPLHYTLTRTQHTSSEWTAHFHFDLIYFIFHVLHLFSFSLPISSPSLSPPFLFNIIIIIMIAIITIESPVKLISFYCFDGAICFVLFFPIFFHFFTLFLICVSFVWWLV